MFTFNNTAEVHFGAGVLQTIDTVLEEYGYKSYVVIASNSQVRNGITELLDSLLPGQIKAVVSDIEENPTVGNVDDIINAAVEHDVDALIAVGGGSTMDAAKAAAAAVVKNVDAGTIIHDKNITEALPVIALPSTSGSASEVTPFSVISDKEKGIKTSISGKVLYPKVALVDPELTYTCPPKVTAISGIDVICHALDSLGAVNNNPISDGLAVTALRLAFNNLDTACSEGTNAEARSNMALASTTAGIGFSQTATSGSHAMSYYLTSEFNIPHAEACAFSLDQWILHNSKVDSRLDEASVQLGFKNTEELSVELNELKKRIGLRTTFEELGIDRRHIPEIARQTMAAGNYKNNLAQLSEDEIIEMLETK
ncbi:alcohol dehydrogenase [Jeotgalicoccus coquinae]|uniref:Alcohol dehydrogenase n=1 Tax=Jeotgalicoccus coquinae TaxID=709509 RepID=A0A6V7RSN9_9STAP|nr:iron-containing alcohol dehydrogenase [Jeotgalicoccus coquinae]MBB6424169.1 alcohol dehydrogenase [Jeotgalicoccus coquinae]GGE25962.1 alcohol dehydrogenase [Jeotgalicoccus coquinae]CAD2081454.1 Alcohol dehydrogenase 2 [Jeotgalicoccus coquinae]